VAEFVAHLLATAYFWVRIQTYLKNTNGRYKQRSGQDALARRKKYRNITIFLEQILHLWSSLSIEKIYKLSNFYQLNIESTLESCDTDTLRLENLSCETVSSRKLMQGGNILPNCDAVMQNTE
jgi:hypothetical protein